MIEPKWKPWEMIFVKHYPGYYQSHMEVVNMDEAELLNLIDALYGRGTLPEDYTLDQLRTEAMTQHEREWRMP